MLPLWRTLQNTTVLQCPSCSADLKVDDRFFECFSCSSRFPVEDGVPLLIRPVDVESIPDYVMGVFNIGTAHRDRVQAALATLMKYRTSLHPAEFSNFFARFEGREQQIQPTPLDALVIAESVKNVQCLSSYFSKNVCPGDMEYRSIRLRNGSDRILYTDENHKLYLSYKVYTQSGEPVLIEGARSQLPFPLRPGSELTVPVMFGLPAHFTGRFIVRFYFLLEHVRWFDDYPLLEVVVNTDRVKLALPAICHDVTHEFEFQEDMT